MLHVHPRAQVAALTFLMDHDQPIPAEKLAERINYSVPQTKRIIAILRQEELISASRPEGSRALAYQVNEESARERGLL